MPNARYGYVLTINEDGRVVWSSINNNNILPSQAGLSGYVLSTNGSAIQWAQQVAGSGGSSSLSGLSDVSLTIPSSGQFLSYDTSDNKWKNVPAPTGGGGVTTYIGATGVLVQGNQIRMGGTGVLNELIIQDSTSNSLIIQPATGSTQDMQVWRTNSLQSLAVGSDGHFKMGSEDFTQPKICFWDTNIADPDVWVAGISWYNNDIAFGEANHPYTKLYFYNNSAGDYDSWLEYSGGDTFYIYGDGNLANLNLGSISTDGVSVGSQQVKFYENTGSGSNFFALKSPPSLSSDITLILPSGAGVNGQVLTSSGNNNMLYWSTPAGTTYTAGSGLTLIGSQFNLAGTGVLNKLTIDNQQSSNVPLISKGAAAQSANLFEAQNVSGANLAYIDKDGDIFTVGSGTFEFVQLNSNLASRSGVLFLDNNKLISTAPNFLFTNINLASPKLIFKASGSATPDISLNILTTASGSTSGVQTLSFEGSAGQLFSISDVLNSGTIFGVNDISGLPLFEIDASGFVRIGRFAADVEVYKQLELLPTGTTSGQTNELRFFELASSGSNYVGFKSPDSITTNRIWTLPTGDGTSNQLLTTNGAGILSWSTPSSGTATALNTTAVSNNATFYPVLSSGTGSSAASIDLGLTYNPSTDMLTASGVTANRIVGSTNIIITESTTARTLQSGDNGGIIHCTNTSGATLTIPTGLPVGFSVGVLAAATGVVSFATSSTTLNNRQSHTKLAGQWAMGTIIQRTTNNFVLAGDTV